MKSAATASSRVAALFVETGGTYFDLALNVIPWDEKKNALRYDGPYPVVAHPPCRYWSIMGQCRGYRPREEDYRMFGHALRCVEKFGGVLEHPAHSKAWRSFGLADPPTSGWTGSLFRPGWTCEVDQAWYGHRANKRTWLYYVGPTPPDLHWGPAPFTGITIRNDGGGHTRPDGTYGSRAQRSRTPDAFRDALLDMARSVRLEAAA